MSILSVFGKKKQPMRKSRRYVIVNEDISFAATEAYKVARTNLMFLLASEAKKQVIFSSPHSEEGKTITCVNMAVAFAQTGAKTLLIDADLRKPKIHRILGVDKVPGLSDYLGGMASDPAVFKTKFENLFVMPVGTMPPNPAELLLSDNMQKLLDELSAQYDYVFIDTPPITLVTDAAVLAAKTAGAVLIARQAVSDKHSMRAAKESLESAGAKVLAFIFNDVNHERYSYRYNYRRGSYYYNYKYRYKYGYRYADPKDGTKTGKN